MSKYRFHTILQRFTRASLCAFCQQFGLVVTRVVRIVDIVKAERAISVENRNARAPVSTNTVALKDLTLKPTTRATKKHYHLSVSASIESSHPLSSLAISTSSSTILSPRSKLNTTSGFVGDVIFPPIIYCAWIYYHFWAAAVCGMYTFPFTTFVF